MVKGKQGFLLRCLDRQAAQGRVAEDADGILLERFVAHRDEASFAALLRRHGPMVLAVCRRVLRDAHGAEDAFQATFLVLLRKGESVRRHQSLAAWLHRVAYHTALRARAAAARRRDRERQVADMPRTEPMTETAWQELRDVLDEELGQLPERYRLPLVLHYLEGRTKEEAARHLGWPEGTVSGRLARGRDLLRVRLTRRGLTLSASVLPVALASSAAAAPVPVRLMASTAKVVLLSAATAIPAAVSSLADGVLRTMAASRWRLLTAVLLLLGTLGGGTALAVQRLIGTTPPKSEIRNPKSETDNRVLSDFGFQISDLGGVAPKADRPRIDRAGDPLPAGAIACMGTTRFRHVGQVHCVAFSRYGKTLASCSWGDHTIRLWQMDPVASGGIGKELTPLRGHTNDVQWLTFSADGSRLASAGYGEAVRLWDPATGRQLHEFRVGSDGGAFSPDGILLASGGPDQLIRVWDTATGKAIHQLKGHRSSPRRLAFSADGKTLASGGEDGTLRLWDVASGKELRAWATGKGAVESVAFSPTAALLVSACGDGTVRLWDPTAAQGVGMELGRFGEPSGKVFAVAFAPDGKTLAASSRMIRLWDVRTRKEVRRFGAREMDIPTIAFSPDGKTLASGNQYQSVQLWDVATGKERYPFAAHHGPVHAVAFAPRTGVLATGGRDDTVRLWDAASGRPLRTLPAGQYWVRSVAFSPDGQTLASAGDGSFIHLWDAATGKEIRRLQGGMESVAFSPDGKLLAAGGVNGGIRVWDAATGGEVLRGAASPKATWSVAFSPDGRLLAAGGGNDDPDICVWDVTAGRVVRRLGGHKGGAKTVAWSPDGKVLASGVSHQDPVIRLWDAATGKELQRLQGHTGYVFALAFSPDGRTLASAGGFEERVIRLWEVATGAERLWFGPRPDWVHALAWAPDGKSLVSGSQDSTAVVWDVTGGQRRPARDGLPVAKWEGFWTDLAGADAPRAYRAIWALAAVPRQTCTLMAERLHPVVAPDKARIARLIADLDRNSFAARQKASRELEAAGEAIAPALRKTLAAKPSLEVSRRVQELLDKIGGPGPSARTRQALRAVEALEHASTTEARRVLQALAGGSPEMALTQQARLALQRLARLRD